MRVIAGVDGCADGWVCVLEHGAQVSVFVVTSFTKLIEQLTSAVVIAIDVPVGLTDKGARLCDLEARRLLGAPRASSVFAAPVRSALAGRTYAEVCEAHYRADGRRISKQAFAILPKIKEVDDVLSAQPALQDRVREVHPEVCFAVWNGGRAMQYRKSRADGRTEREALIDAVWPNMRVRLRQELRPFRCEADDLNDAFAALWTARRISNGVALVLPRTAPKDRLGLRMEMLA